MIRSITALTALSLVVAVGVGVGVGADATAGRDAAPGHTLIVRTGGAPAGGALAAWDRDTGFAAHLSARVPGLPGATTTTVATWTSKPFVLTKRDEPTFVFNTDTSDSRTSTAQSRGRWRMEYRLALDGRWSSWQSIRDVSPEYYGQPLMFTGSGAFSAVGFFFVDRDVRLQVQWRLRTSDTGVGTNVYDTDLEFGDLGPSVRSTSGPPV